MREREGQEFQVAAVEHREDAVQLIRHGKSADREH